MNFLPKQENLPPDSKNSPMHDDNEQSPAVTEKSVEDSCTSTIQSPTSDVLQDLGCDHETVGFRLIDEEEKIEDDLKMTTYATCLGPQINNDTPTYVLLQYVFS